MSCEFCQRDVDTMEARLHYTVGLGFTHVDGGARQDLCRRCIRTAFWVYFPINLTVGWLSFGGFRKNAGMLRNNLRAYGATRRMSDGRPSQRPPAPAPEPTLSEHAA
jgi:hypothetical protein